MPFVCFPIATYLNSFIACGWLMTTSQLDDTYWRANWRAANFIQKPWMNKNMRLRGSKKSYLIEIRRSTYWILLVPCHLWILLRMGGEENGFLVDKLPGIRFCGGILLLQSSSLDKMADICYWQPSGGRWGRVTLWNDPEIWTRMSLRPEKIVAREKWIHLKTTYRALIGDIFLLFL